MTLASTADLEFAVRDFGGIKQGRKKRLDQDQHPEGNEHVPDGKLSLFGIHRMNCTIEWSGAPMVKGKWSAGGSRLQHLVSTSRNDRFSQWGQFFLGLRRSRAPVLRRDDAEVAGGDVGGDHAQRDAVRGIFDIGTKTALRTGSSPRSRTSAVARRCDHRSTARHKYASCESPTAVRPDQGSGQCPH